MAKKPLIVGDRVKVPKPETLRTAGCAPSTIYGTVTGFGYKAGKPIRVTIDYWAEQHDYTRNECRRLRKKPKQNLYTENDIWMALPRLTRTNEIFYIRLIHALRKLKGYK